MDKTINLDKAKFQGVYASTWLEPTKKEIEYVMQHLKEIFNSHNKEPYYQIREFSAENHGLECSCLDENRNKETNVTSYEFQLDETMTDVPRDDWDDYYARKLYILICEDCKEWCMCD